MLTFRVPRFAVVSLALAVVLAPVAFAASGRPQLQTFFQSDVISASYQQKVFQRVAARWQQPGPKGTPAIGKKTVVQAIISKDGKLISANVTTESGSKAWDAAALSAVKKSAPFPALPAGQSLPTVEVHFHVGWVAGT